MGRNRIKIVSNKNLKTISYYLKNENSEWMPVDNSSPLSRKEYTEVFLNDNIEKILRTIDEIYNVGNRGVDIQFEGSNDEYLNICSALGENNSIVNISKSSNINIPDMNISCEHRKSQMIVVGKIKSGKSTFIEEFCKFNDIQYSIKKDKEYIRYISEDGNITWYELNGLDLGKEYITIYEKTMETIVSRAMTVYIYCISTSKIEKAEEKIIMDIKNKYPDVKILVVLTSYIEDDALLVAEQMSKQMSGIKVIPILAKDMRTRQGVIPSFGLELVSQYIYGGR